MVSNFIVQALQNAPITIYGDGSQTRSFCYVSDMIDGITQRMDSRDDLIGPMNLSNPVECTMRELAEQVIELTGSLSRLACLPLPQDDPRQRRPDITLARQQLGWKPAIPLRSGLASTIAYFDALLGRTAA